MRFNLMKYAFPILISAIAHAADPAPTQSPAPQVSATPEAEEVNVENIKEKYWARGEESELGVVQNRTYSKEHKYEFGIFGGIISSDPLVSTQSLGAHFGYYFSEYFSLQAVAWKSWASPSSASQALNSQIQATQGVGLVPSTDYANGYYGAEGSFSLLYGKLSLVGQSIIYYDLHFLVGSGITVAEAGNYFTPEVGLGQSIYLSKVTSLRFDYRMMYYRDQLIDKSNPNASDYLQPSGPYRNNWTNSFTLGVDFLIGGGSK